MVYGRAYLKFADSAFGAGRMQEARDYYAIAVRYQPQYGLDAAFLRHWMGTFIGYERYNRIKPCKMLL